MDQFALHAQSVVGSSAGSWFDFTLNNHGTINVILDKEADRHTDEALIVALVADATLLLERIKFAPDAKSDACNGFFYCDPATNIWAQEFNGTIEGHIVDAFSRVDGLTADDTKHIESRRGRSDMRRILAAKVADKTFLDELDANLDLFALDNGVFDMRPDMRSFRPIRFEDRITTTSGWTYDAMAAIQYRSEVDVFLERVFPIAEERRVVLTYAAHLLSGRRTVKKFLVLTDRRAGNNGKSTFAKLLGRFFGGLAKSSTKFVCKGSFEAHRDSHDASLEPFKGKRLLVAEELKHNMTLDDAMLKAYSGGEDTIVEGRRCGSAQTFKYVWQAGFLLIFNEGDCPKFDPADQAFAERMIVAPMRSKFVRELNDEDEENTFLMDLDIVTKFPMWRSALADVLLEHGDLQVLLSVPASMREWRQGMVEAANPLSAWLEERILVTGQRTDFIVMGELKGVYNKFVEDTRQRLVAQNEFQKLAQSFLRALPGVTFKEQDNVRSKSARNVLRGITMEPLFLEDDSV